MIVVDAEDSKSQQVIVPQQGQLNGHFGSVHPQSSSLPASAPPYTPSYHTTPLLPPPPPPSYPKHPGHHPAPPTPAVIQYRQSPAGRFCKAFAVALVIYLAILTLTRTIVHMATGGIRLDHGSVGVPRPEDGRVLESIGSLNWTSYHARPHWAPDFSDSAETSFVLPVASQELYLISRGVYQGGKVQVKQSTEQGDVRVDVRVAYHDQRALAHATVCRLHKSGSRDGVGIYTPTLGWSNPSRDRLLFDVVFTFPAAKSADAPLRINEFTLLTSNFAHEIGDLWRSILFENIELNTSNSPIRVDSITLTRGSLTSSNGPIIGHFNSSDSLNLHTSNALIQATASLFSAGRNPVKLDMRTSNSPITSSVWLITDSGTGGNFVVKSRTSNGATKLQYEDAPSRARLLSEVRTSNGPASVVMHPAFEGTYEVSTSNSRPVVVDTHPTDPTGAGRRRVVNQTTSRSAVSGRAYWVGRDGMDRGESTCTVHTSNAPASLDL